MTAKMTAELHETTNFWLWILRRRDNRWYLVLSVAAMVAQFIIFKYIFPYPNFLPDSYSYLEVAMSNQDVNIWPIGYSRFLHFFGFVSHSDTALVLFQYLLLQLSILYFVFTLVYFLQPGRVVTALLFAIGVLNPLVLHVSNLISADALFTALSICWATQLFRIMQRSRLPLLIFHAVLLVLAFMVRYNALYYPVVSIAVILFSRGRMPVKAAGILLILVFTGAFIIHTGNTYKKVTGTWQFSPFGGWQLASNALYMYAHVKPEPARQFPADLRLLHSKVIRHMDSLRNTKHRPDSLLGIYYLWSPPSPLKQVLNSKYSGDTVSTYLKKWASVAPVYGRYGAYAIRRHPLDYARYYLLPNFINYYAPGSEFLGVYNMGKNTVDPAGKKWFRYKTNRVTMRAKYYQIAVMEPYGVIMALVNLCFFLGGISFFVLNGIKCKRDALSGLLVMAFMLWLANAVFSITASPVVLRYQVFPMVISAAFSLVVIAAILKMAMQKEEAHLQKNTTGTEEPLMSGFSS